MHLKQTRQKSGKTNLSIVESWWDPDKKRSRQRTVENLGYLEDLLREHEDPVSWGRARAAKMTEEKAASTQDVLIGIHPAQKIDKRAANRKNMGCAVALSQYAALGIERALRNRMRGSRMRFDLNAVARLLVCERIADPGSKLSAWSRRERYFFRTDFSDDDLYRALDALAASKGPVVSAMNRSIARAGIRDASCVYYDVTNYYFECDGEDELRRKGASKERRTSPLVQMGLLQDSGGVPIAYRVFSGNTPDSATLIPVLSEMKQSLGAKRIVTVADKGLNCSSNIAAAIASGNGFVFSQSLRGSKSDKALKAWALDGAGYARKTKSETAFRSKSKQGFKTVHLKAEDTIDGKAKDVAVEVKYVAFWSEKYERRARRERAKTIERAERLVADPGSYTRATGHGAAQYVKNLAYDKKTGQIVEGRKLEIDWNAVQEAEKYDGYYLIVTSETDWDDERVIEAYRELWRIEESFKVTKSDLATRPVHVWTPAHIEAHFLICYIALVILRLLQRATGLSCSRIRKELAAMSGTNVESNWWVFDHRSDASDLLVEAVGLEDLKLKNLTTGKAAEILAKAAKGEIPQAK